MTIPAKKTTSIFVFCIVAIVLALLLGCSSIGSQRLCENNDNPVATISPCEGPTGTTITVTPGRTLASAPGTLVFKRVIANGVPAEVVTQVSGSTVSSPAQLCMGGNGRWEVWLALVNGQAQGKIGAFWSTGCVGGTSTGLNIPPAISSGTPPKELVVLPPITMNVDNEVYAKTRSTSQSYIKNISSSAPEIATATEWGTNEVKILGKKPGTTTISFLDANTGTIYQVDVTVNEKPKPLPGGDGRAESKAIETQPSHCLIGAWRSVSGEVGPRTGGSGVVLTIKANGEASADYSKMQDLTDGTYYIKHSGKGTAFIKFDDSVITVEREVDSTVRFESTNPGGRVGAGATTALGPIIDPFGKTVDFTCNGNTLVFEPRSKFSKYTFERIQ